MSQIAAEVPRESRDPDPNTTSPSTRYAHSTSRSPPPTTHCRCSATASNLAGNQVSMQAALASANGDPLVALETILGERNTLSSQNSQLWKIIEKQRGMYNSLHKELDRAKAERDRLQSKSSAETSTKRPAAGESTPRKQLTRSQSEDRRESQYSVLHFLHLKRGQLVSPCHCANFAR
jgi:RalA-binding protein 1